MNAVGFEEFVFQIFKTQSEFHGFKLIKKSESLLMRVIGLILYYLSMKKLKFCDDYHTVVGKTLYTGTSWDTTMIYLEKAEIIRHERVHLQQMKRCGLGCFWLGLIVFSILYVFILPCVFTLHGFWFEREAYQESIRARKEYGLHFDKEWIVSQFVGPYYFWMFPFRSIVEKWFEYNE